MAVVSLSRRGVDRARTQKSIQGLDVQMLEDLGLAPAAAPAASESASDRPMVTHSALLWAMPSLSGR